MQTSHRWISSVIANKYSEWNSRDNAKRLCCLVITKNGKPWQQVNKHLILLPNFANCAVFNIHMCVFRIRFYLLIKLQSFCALRPEYLLWIVIKYLFWIRVNSAKEFLNLTIVKSRRTNSQIVSFCPLYKFFSISSWISSFFSKKFYKIAIWIFSTIFSVATDKIVMWDCIQVKGKGQKRTNGGLWFTNQIKLEDF